MAISVPKQLGAVFFIVTVVTVGLYLQEPSAVSPMSKIITIGSTQVSVDVADTPLLREQGLSGRAHFAKGQGMLFIFETDDVWGIWMKNMLFPIDIVWMDAAGVVVSVAPNVSPDTFPKSFRPTSPARYVLELPAGYARDMGLVEGIKIVL